jgi:hypothetical protein
MQNRNSLSIKCVCISVAIYAISLTQTAYTFYDVTGKIKFSSIMALLMGATAILGGALLEWIVWLANPFYTNSKLKIVVTIFNF